jgi:hypothetical protein
VAGRREAEERELPRGQLRPAYATMDSGVHRVAFEVAPVTRWGLQAGGAGTTAVNLTIASHVNYLNARKSRRQDKGPSMAIDWVAVYAAVVSTGALGWQVQQWRSDHTGRLDVEVAASHSEGIVNGAPPGTQVSVEIVNSNDYVVKLLWVTVHVIPPDGRYREGPKNGRYRGPRGWARPGEPISLAMPASEPGNALPGEVPAHDSVRWTWNRDALYALSNSIGAAHLTAGPGDLVIVTIKTSLRRTFEGRSRVPRPPVWTTI